MKYNLPMNVFFARQPSRLKTRCVFIYPLEMLESLVTFQGVPLEDYYKNSTCAVR